MRAFAMKFYCTILRVDILDNIFG